MSNVSKGSSTGLGTGEKRWVVRENRELGKEGRVWELTREGLSVGRCSDRDIQLLSQTVEEKHAAFEWHAKMESYVIRDLGTINGTYVNNIPLRGQFTMLEHGAAIRFGYEKSHTFRVEVVEQNPTPPTLMPTATPTYPHSSSSSTSSSVASTQTSPPTVITTPSQQAMNIQYVPVSSQPPTIFIPAGQSTMPYLVQQPVSYAYSSPLHMQQSPVLQQSNMLFQPVSSAHLLQHQPAPPPFLHQPAMPTFLQQQRQATPTGLSVEDVESESVFTVHSEDSPKPRKDGRKRVSLPDLETPNLSKGSPLYGQPDWWGEERERTSEYLSSEEEIGSPGPTSRILQVLEPRGERIKVVRSLEEFYPSQTRRGLMSHELRKQAVGNRGEKGSEPSTSWVIDLPSSSGRTKPRSARLDRFRERRPRSADPSPTRAKTSVSPVRRSMSPGVTSASKHSPIPARKATSNTTTSKKDAMTSTSPQKTVSRKPPSGPRPSGGLKVTTPTSKTRQAHVTSPAAKATTKEMRERPRGEGRKEASQKCSAVPVSLPSTSQNQTYILSHEVDDSRSHFVDPSVLRTTYSKPSDVDQPPPPSSSSPANSSIFTPLKSASDTQVSSEPCPLRGDATFVIADPRETDRPSSARKQWSHSQPQAQDRKQWSNGQPQAPDSLMLASIEARMRRLSQMAQATAQTVSALKHLPVHALQRTDHEAECPLSDTALPPSPISPSHVSTPGKQDLPEWKFFNKEVDSIFRNIRSVERWIREIDSTAVSLQLMRGTEVGQVWEEEEVDYEGEEDERGESEGEGEEEGEDEFLSAESECEMFPDSIEDSYLRRLSSSSYDSNTET